MPVPPNAYRVVFAGGLPGGENWSTGFWVVGDAPTSDTVAESTAQLWFGEANATDGSGGMHDLIANYWSNTVSWTTTTVYSYPAGGTKAEYIGVYSQVVNGLGSQAYLPDQVALVVSLRTGTAGRRNRGRCYLPFNAIGGLTAAGELPLAICTDVATVWSTMFSDWNASGDNGTVSVVSQTATASKPVTSLIVDTRLDIQRRRAASQSISGAATKPVT